MYFYFVFPIQLTAVRYQQQLHRQRGHPETPLPNRTQHLQQKAGQGNRLSDQKRISGKFSASRCQVSHHPEGIVEADDRRVSRQHHVPVQHGRPQLLHPGDGLFGDAGGHCAQEISGIFFF